MFRFCLRIAIIATAFVGFLILVRAVGARGKNPLADTFTEITLANGQKQVCWRGICPKVTTVDEAKAILDTDLTLTEDSRASIRASCWRSLIPQELTRICLSISDDQINELVLDFDKDMALTNQTGVRLGDAVSNWGIPEDMTYPMCGNGISDLVFSNNVSTTVYWFRVRDYNPDQDISGILILDPALSRILRITIGNSTSKGDFVAPGDWRGFIVINSAPYCGGD